MPTTVLSKKLQKPSIISLVGSTIKVAHPDISNYPMHFLRSSFTAGGTTLTVDDNNSLADDEYIVLGAVGDAKTEEVDINGAVTRGTSLTITNSTKFSHDVDTPLTKIYERQVKIYGAATDGGSGTAVATVSIQWDRQFTTYTIVTSDTTYAYYYVTFYDGSSVESAASDYVTYSSGLANNAIQNQVESALLKTDEDINESGKITRQFMLVCCNDWQDKVTQWVLNTGTSLLTIDWDFELVKNDTSISSTENENEYALSGLTYTLKYPNSNQGIKNVRLGDALLDYIDPGEMDEAYENTHRTNLAVQALAADTSITVDDTSEFSDSGSAYLGEDLITYTAKTSTTFTGIPASGTGSISTTHAVDSPVWSGVEPGMPQNYTIFNGSVVLDKPVDADHAGWKLKFKYLKKLTRFTDFSDTTEIPFYNTLSTFLRAMIEYRKGNRTEGDALMLEFNNEVDRNAKSRMTPAMDSYSYHKLRDKDNG